jgi:hypothetical protein
MNHSRLAKINGSNAIEKFSPGDLLYFEFYEDDYYVGKNILDGSISKCGTCIVLSIEISNALRHNGVNFVTEAKIMLIDLNRIANIESSLRFFSSYSDQNSNIYRFIKFDEL